MHILCQDPAVLEVEVAKPLPQCRHVFALQPAGGPGPLQTVEILALFSDERQVEAIDENVGTKEGEATSSGHVVVEEGRVCQSFAGCRQDAGATGAPLSVQEAHELLQDVLPMAALAEAIAQGGDEARTEMLPPLCYVLRFVTTQCIWEGHLVDQFEIVLVLGIIGTDVPGAQHFRLPERTGTHLHACVVDVGL